MAYEKYVIYGLWEETYVIYGLICNGLWEETYVIYGLWEEDVCNLWLMRRGRM